MSVQSFYLVKVFRLFLDYVKRLILYFHYQIPLCLHECSNHTLFLFNIINCDLLNIYVIINAIILKILLALSSLWWVHQYMEVLKILDGMKVYDVCYDGLPFRMIILYWYYLNLFVNRNFLHLKNVIHLQGLFTAFLTKCGFFRIKFI